MIGFAAFIVILLAGILGLVGGLQWISAQRREPLPGADNERLNRLESALSTLESRLDEMQDQQRFLERLLAERPERSLGAGDGDSPREPSGGVDSILFETDEDEESDR